MNLMKDLEKIFTQRQLQVDLARTLMNPEFFRQILELSNFCMHRDQYAELLPIDTIFAYQEVCARGIERCENMLEAGKDLGTIVVIRHPRMYRHVVFDGTHRYRAQRNKGFTEISAAPFPDKFGLLYHATEENLLRPTKEFTENVRMPWKRFGENLKNTLYNMK